MTKTIPKELKNAIICGDCRARMKQIPDGSVDLIYLDPPFFSGKNYDLIWGDSKATIQSFEDAAFYKKVCGRCGKDWCNKDNGDDYEQCEDSLCKAPIEEAKNVRMNDIAVYTAWLKDRLQECYRVLKPTGSIYVHLDWHAVHYVKVAMDDIFGYGNFQNEIIWAYKGGAQSKKRFPRKHDNIMFYTKSKDHTFNYDDPGLKTEYCRKLKNEVAVRKNKTYGWKGNPLGKMIEDWWEMPIINPTSKERIGYPTQKPEALLERIILASSNVGDIILDPFCGCGTTITVAQRLDRKWIGIDIEPLSCTIQQIRMEKTFGLKIPIIDLGKTLSEEEIDTRVIEARKMNPYEFQDWVVTVLGGTVSKRKSDDHGIDGTFNEGIDSANTGNPIQVKRSENVGTQVIRLFAQDTRAISRTHGTIVAFGFASTAKKEANTIRARDGITIELLTVKNMLMQVNSDTKSTRKTQKGKQAKLKT